MAKSYFGWSPHYLATSQKFIEKQKKWGLVGRQGILYYCCLKIHYRVPIVVA
jgi:hypothetical protein